MTDPTPYIVLATWFGCCLAVGKWWERRIRRKERQMLGLDPEGR